MQLMSLAHPLRVIKPMQNVKLFEDKKELCPVLKFPYGHCYCLNMNSQKIEKVIQFCAGDYFLCEVYKKKLVQEKVY